MTIIITRLFPDSSAAQNAANRLQLRGIPKNQCDIIVAGDSADTHMARAMVHEGAIGAYGAKLASGMAVLVVRTTYRPLGAAKLTRDILAKRETVDVGNVLEEHYVPTPFEKKLSILKDHPHMLTLPGFETSGRMSDIVGMPLLKQRKTRRSTMAPDRRMSRMFWPMPLLSSRSRRKSVVPNGGFQFSRLLRMPTIK